MRVADFIFKFLSDRGVDTVFMVSGGQAMFLVDAIYRNKNIKPICTHHEQSAGMSADAYGRVSGRLGVALVTAGPGSMNVLNGVAGGWTDSAPMMIVSGQSALSYVQYQENSNIRQHGIQGINIKPIVKNITKYFVTVEDPCKILYYMQKAYYLATTGRFGPVWIDVPIDVQKMEVPDKLLEEFEPPADIFDNDLLKEQVSQVMRFLSDSKRPIFIVGQGVRMSKAVNEFTRVIEKLNIPVLTSRLGIDLIHSDSRLYVGRPGIYGERAANFAVQNADLIISVGSRLASALVGYDAKAFGKKAKKVVVDIDADELNKPGTDIALKVNDDAKRFFLEILSQVDSFDIRDFSGWVERCNQWKKGYPVVLDVHKSEKPVSSYYFTDRLCDAVRADDMVLVDTGSCFHIVCQAWKVKKGQRFLTTGGLSSMGYWAGALGVCAANNRKRTIVITGDGSLQMNLQEFATIKHYNLPIKVFILNNEWMGMVRQWQELTYESRYSESYSDSLPDFVALAEAYGWKGIRCEDPAKLDDAIAEMLSYDGPVMFDCRVSKKANCFPMIPSGAAHTEMILHSDEVSGTMDDEAKALV